MALGLSRQVVKAPSDTRKTENPHYLGACAWPLNRSNGGATRDMPRTQVIFGAPELTYAAPIRARY
jgi:hypothetical protein